MDTPEQYSGTSLVPTPGVATEKPEVGTGADLLPGASTSAAESQKDGSSSVGFTDLEATKLTLDAWKFRQAHAWSALTRYYFAAAFISAVPYLLDPCKARWLGELLYVFPVAGAVLGIAAIWIYAAEYIRAQPYGTAFREKLITLRFVEGFKLTRAEKWLRLGNRIGAVTYSLLGAGTLVLGAVNIVLVFQLLSNVRCGSASP